MQFANISDTNEYFKSLKINDLLPNGIIKADSNKKLDSIPLNNNPNSFLNSYGYFSTIPNGNLNCAESYFVNKTDLFTSLSFVNWLAAPLLSNLNDQTCAMIRKVGKIYYVHFTLNCSSCQMVQGQNDININWNVLLKGGDTVSSQTSVSVMNNSSLVNPVSTVIKSFATSVSSSLLTLSMNLSNNTTASNQAILSFMLVFNAS